MTDRPNPPAVGAEMVLLDGGEFLMGNAGPYAYPDDGEGPVRRVRLDSFWVDRCAVSNADSPAS
jgi:formylglycine-generating enzyme